MIGTDIYPLAVIHLISSWNIKQFNHSPVIVEVIGRPVHRIISIASSCLSYKIYMYVLCLKQLPISASRPAYWQAACLFYLGARPFLVSSNNCNINCQLQTNKKITTMCESVNKSENHHKLNMCATIKLC